jgi:uncharacterized protein
MIRKLNIKDKRKILDFCYKNEKENLFAIGSFKFYKNPFKENIYWGYFDGKKMIGLAVYFGRFGNFVINTSDKKAMNDLIDEGVNSKIKIRCISAFENYTKPMLLRLKNKYKIVPKKYSDEYVLVLNKKDFNDFSEGDEKQASSKDIDELAKLNGGINFVNDEERKRVFPKNEFVLRKNGKIVSKANLHGVSKNYFQIGGVATRIKYRRKGFARRVVSSLCKYHFKKGIKFGLLFTGKDNIAAQNLYKSIGFKKTDKFIIAEF